MAQCAFSAVISAASHILWLNILDTQDCVSYTADNEKQVLINQFYSAREIEKMGLVNNVYPNMENLFAEAKKLAGLITANPPMAVMATKEVINYSWTASIADGMLKAIEKNALFMTSQDILEAVSAFTEKRKPSGSAHC